MGKCLFLYFSIIKIKNKIKYCYCYCYIGFRERALVNLKYFSYSFMDTDNSQLVDLLQEIRPQLPLEIQPKIDDLIFYYQKK